MLRRDNIAAKVSLSLHTEDLQLVEPSRKFEDNFLAMAAEYLREGDKYEKERYRAAIRDFSAYLRGLHDAAKGVALPEGHVPATTYWLVRDGETIVATSSIRHWLTPSLLHEGGHVGYGTRPSERRKGYGKIVCAKTLEKAGEMGLDRVLITCDTDNTASAKIIQANGGALENRVIAHTTGKQKNRYWIDVQTARPGVL